jgi:DNA-binding NtrC family response regulator
MAARDDIRSRIIGNSPVFKEALERAERAAKAPTKIPVELDGERGTGKELFAKLIHELSTPEGPFVAINCAAISPGIAESEFFGHDAGAFTGATKVSIGAFERANGGTLFLDEIHTLSLEIQSKLLRVLQEMEIQRVGSGRVRKLNMRIITASNCDLEAMCRAGTFKRDLYDRINVYVIKLPALRERREDILPIAHHLLQNIAPQKTFSPEAEYFLENSVYPGNIRVLKNLIWAASVDAGESEMVRLDHIKQNLEGKLPGYEARYEPEVTVPALKVVYEEKQPLPKINPANQNNKVKKTVRHQIILSLLKQKIQASSSDFLAATGVSKATVERDLKGLVDTGIIHRLGKAKNTCYVLANAVLPSDGGDKSNRINEKTGADGVEVLSHVVNRDQVGLETNRDHDCYPYDFNSDIDCEMRIFKANRDHDSYTENLATGPKGNAFPSGNNLDQFKERRKKKVYNAILESAIEAKTISELMDIVGRKNRSKFRNAFIRPLLDAGFLQMTRPDKPRSRKQKYVTFIHEHGANKDTSEMVQLSDHIPNVHTTQFDPDLNTIYEKFLQNDSYMTLLCQASEPVKSTN